MAWAQSQCAPIAIQALPCVSRSQPIVITYARPLSKPVPIYTRLFTSPRQLDWPGFNLFKPGPEDSYLTNSLISCNDFTPDADNEPLARKGCDTLLDIVFDCKDMKISVQVMSSHKLYKISG